MYRSIDAGFPVEFLVFAEIIGKQPLHFRVSLQSLEELGVRDVGDDRIQLASEYLVPPYFLVIDVFNFRSWVVDGKDFFGLNNPLTFEKSTPYRSCKSPRAQTVRAVR